jgi:hypothetical protein
LRSEFGIHENYPNAVFFTLSLTEATPLRCLFWQALYLPKKRTPFYAPLRKTVPSPLFFAVILWLGKKTDYREEKYLLLRGKILWKIGRECLICRG